MKKVFLILSFCIIPLLANAQWILTPDGFKTESDEEYLVVPFEGMTAAEIQSKVKSYIAVKYVSPKDVISELESTISMNANGVLKWEGNGGIMTYTSEFNFTTSFQFKDGRMRINAPYLTYFDVGGRELFLSGPNLLGVETGIYRPNGKLTRTFTPLKTALEDYMNLLLDDLKNFIEGNVEDEDW